MAKKLAKGKTYGKIMDQNSKGLRGIKVECWDDDYPDADDRMGVTYTDAYGNYSFRYPGGWDYRIKGSTRFRPDIYVTASIKNNIGRWCQLKKSRVYSNHKLATNRRIDLKLNIAAKQRKSIPFDFQKLTFKFPNSFKVKDLIDEFEGDVAMGLCGGMVAGVLHRFKHGCLTPTQTTTPRKGSHLYNELFSRQVITLVDGEIVRIWNWQRSPDIPHAHTPHSIRYRQKGQWKVLKSYIDNGKPAILCLIRQEGYLADIWSNHQVLAYGYEYEPTPRNLTVTVYDPNDKGGPNTLKLCLSGGRLGAHQINSKGQRINFRGFLVMTTTDKASNKHI